jgi:hypothetical protein
MEKIYFTDEGPKKRTDRGPKAAGGYREAVEACELSRSVIENYHPHLAEANISYLYRSGRWRMKERTITGKAVVASQLWRHLSGHDLVLILSEVIFTNLSEEGKVALLDHELSHFNAPVTDKYGGRIWSTRDHDVREFSAVVKRHNICMSNLGAIAAGGMEQLDMMKSLNDTVEDAEAVAAVYGDEAEEVEEDDLFCEEYEEL